MPSTFERPKLLIIGCGDVGKRVARLLSGRFRIDALTSSDTHAEELRSMGIRPLVGDLDRPDTLHRLGALAPRILHLAPPAANGEGDQRTGHLIRVLERQGVVRRIVYGSTTGVYGDCQGARFDETRPVAPATDRARRRVDAEAQLRAFGLRAGVVVTILRIPGIYARDRPGGHPRERLLRGTPVLDAAHDVHTNHIHADDLARACIAALWRGRPQRVVHASDDTTLKLGDYLDVAAALCGLPAPRRISMEEAQVQLSPMQLSFMRESRQLVNERLKKELKVVLRYPTVREGLLA